MAARDEPTPFLLKQGAVDVEGVGAIWWFSIGLRSSKLWPNRLAVRLGCAARSFNLDPAGEAQMEAVD